MRDGGNSTGKPIYPFRLLFHPLACSTIWKFEKKAALPLATLLALLFFWRGVALRPPPRGIGFNPTAARISKHPTNFGNGTVGIVLIWTVCNRAMCTLNNGEGEAVRTLIATAYSLTPYLLLGSIGDRGV
ncbi:MAG: hypothetical protein ACLU9S_01870 [Oscillospiraceae bacterium]